MAPTGPPPTDVATAINDFGFNLLRRTSDSPRNTVISPYSVSSLLSMTANGAKGDTAAQMRRVLVSDGIQPADLEQQWTRLNADMATRSPEQKLELANAMWARRGLALEMPFTSMSRSAFRAQVSTHDFASEDMAPVVNNWFKAKTHGMIPQMVGSIPDNTVLLLANAVYFKGAWEIPFQPHTTQNQPFTLPNGSTVRVPMMSRPYDSLQSVETSSFAMVRLPYKGADSAMYLLLPNQKLGLTNVERALTGSEFLAAAKAVASTSPKELYLGLPRLDIAWGQDNLEETLSAMGMPKALSGAADFSGIAKQKPLYISQFAHKTRIRVGELGTEAAAASFELMAGGLPDSTPPMIFNRPFLFGIVDEKSGTILFLGEVNNPKAK